MVGYNFEPKECLDIIRERDIPCVKGNHDAYCSDEVAPDGLNPRASEHVEWTRQQLTEDDRAWLRSLKYAEGLADFTIVHARLNLPERWGYVSDKVAAAESFAHQKTQVCFFGYTHVPVTFIREKGFMRAPVVRGGTYTSFKVERQNQYFVNVGSVGQPRDGDRRAAYVTYYLVEQVIELRRVPFEVPPNDPGNASVPGQPNRPRPLVTKTAMR